MGFGKVGVNFYSFGGASLIAVTRVDWFKAVISIM